MVSKEKEIKRQYYLTSFDNLKLNYQKIPKFGTTSILNVLSKTNRGHGIHSEKAVKYITLADAYKNNYTTFTVTRHPYDRARSMFADFFFKRKTFELLSLLLDREAKTFPLFEILSCERTLSFPSEKMKVYLTGRIDRISRNEEGVLLVDYKKRNRVNRNDLLGDPPESCQMPFYALLAEETGMEVVHIAYYDIEGKEYSHVLRPPPEKSWIDPDSFRNLISKTWDSIRYMTEAVHQGEYCCTRDSARCIRCEYRRICRERYVLG